MCSVGVRLYKTTNRVNTTRVVISTMNFNPYSGSITAVTDASVIQGQGTWSAILVDKDERTLQQKRGKLQGENLTSFRAELDGCRAAIEMLKEYPNAQDVKLYCGNLAVIKQTNGLTKARALNTVVGL